MPRRKIDVDKKIQDALTDGPLVWSELYTQTEVSKGALSNHLNDLITHGIVLTKIREGRPPVTEYFLANNEQIRIVSYLLRNVADEQVKYFVSEFKGKIFDVIPEIYENLIERYQKRLQDRRKIEHKDFDLKPILKSVNLDSSAIKDEKEFSYSFKISEFFNIDENNEVELDDALLKEIFSEIGLQLILILYSFERNLFDAIPFTNEARLKIINKGKLDGFPILSIIQKYRLWEDFEKLNKWWRKYVMDLVPSKTLLILLALDMFDLQTSYL